LGGDEFVVLFNDLADSAECIQILDRILDMISMPIDIDGHAVTISASIGATFYSANDEAGETLLRQADRAMYVAKHGGKARYHFYDPQQDRH
jgi:diguanylate cyclase (GGDEF)-like protein